jgi:hypothetical protein
MTAFSSNLRSLTVLLAGLITLPGCEFLENLQDIDDDGSILSAFAAHHATPKDGAFPPRNGPPQFITDQGWDVLLADAYITTTGLTMHACNDASKASLEMYWGALPEDLNLQDLETQPMGGVLLSSGDWCGVTVHYGPFMPGGADDYQMPDPNAIGTSVYIRGLATKDDQSVEFTVSIPEPMDVLIPLTDIASGSPLKVTDQNEPDMTISKSYDKLFDGIDFATASQQEIDDLCLAALADHTFVTLGTVILP